MTHPAPSSSSSLVRTWDKSYIRSIWSAPEIYPHISDDYTPENIDPQIAPHIIYLRPFEGGALMMLHPVFNTLWMFHGGVLLPHRSKSKEYATGCMNWMRENTRARCIMSLVAKGNWPAMRLLESVGFKKTGDVAKSLLVDGELKDMRLFVKEL